jgi:hypothetical protein
MKSPNLISYSTNMCWSYPCTTVVYNFHTSLVVVPNLTFAWYPSKPQNNWVFSKEPMSIYRNLRTPTIRGRKPVNPMNEEIGKNLITSKNAQAFCMVQLPFPLCKICYIRYHNLHKFVGFVSAPNIDYWCYLDLIERYRTGAFHLRYWQAC